MARAIDEVADDNSAISYTPVGESRAKSKLDAETLPASATDKCRPRFNAMEDEVRASGKALGELGLEELDAIWNAHKAARTAPEQ
jgi:uncharacterized protein YabN with tetrapyrrole methylase and pyrophosphatase domain